MSAVLELKPIPGAGEAPASSSPPAAAAAQPSILDQVNAFIEMAKKPDSGVNMATLTKLYLKIRDAKKDVDEQAKAKTAPLTASIDALEAFFLAKMQELGTDSLKNEAGTPYKSEKSSVTVADNESFVGWVLDEALKPLAVNDAAKAVIKQTILDSGAFAYIESRASKTAVEAYVEQTKALPPGLNRRSEWTVNVRAS
jgi:hypothetical protein